MFMRNQLGSISALSMAANPAALPVLAAVAGIGVTVAASAFAYHEYKEYEEKKHKEEIENINRLHKKYLARISVPDYNEIQGFPAIFVLPENKDASKAQSMHLTDEDVQAIGNSMPRGTDIALCSYRQMVLSAILKLKEYYFSRSPRNDITAGVISYVLYMLETKCLNFQGYAYDIAYLNALTNFVNAYASVKNSEKSQHFSRLQPVYSYLLYAKQMLEKHKEALSLEELVSELRDSCETYNNQLIRNMVKLVTKNKYWDLVQTVTMDELTQSILRRKYIHTEVKDVVLRTDDELRLSDSIFKYWIMAITEFYLKTLNPDNNLTEKDILNPEQIFTVPDINKLPQFSKDKNKKTKEQNIEIEMIENQLKAIGKIFEKSQNFITTKLTQKNRTDPPKFVPVSDTREVSERTKTLSDFATLIHELISLQYLATQLLKSIKQLGEIYVTNPKHFVSIFRILEGLCDQIKERIEGMQHSFMDIQQKNKNAMQLEIKEIFPNQVNDVLVSTYTMLTRLGTNIKEYRTKVAKNINNTDPTVESVKHQMFEAAQLLSGIYQIQKRVPKKPAPPKEPRPPRAKPQPEPAPAPVVDHAPVVEHAADKIPVQEPVHAPVVAVPPVIQPVMHTDVKEEKAAPPLPFPASPEPAPVIEPVNPVHDEADKAEEIMSAPENKNPAKILEKISTLLSDIYKHILAIQNEKSDDAAQAKPAGLKEEIAAYMNLYNNLVEMAKKADALVNEENKSDARNKKTDFTLELLLNLCLQVDDFLDLDKEQRMHGAKKLAQDIHDVLVNPDNNFIDQHYNKVSAAAYSICHSSLFATDSRKKLNRIEQASEGVSRVLSK